MVDGIIKGESVLMEKEKWMQRELSWERGRGIQISPWERRIRNTNLRRKRREIKLTLGEKETQISIKKRGECYCEPPFIGVYDALLSSHIESHYDMLCKPHQIVNKICLTQTLNYKLKL